MCITQRSVECRSSVISPHLVRLIVQFLILVSDMVNSDVMEESSPVIAWFSCGATSAVACKLALGKYDNVRVVYIDTHSGHSDNLRFIRECEDWYGTAIEVRDNPNWANVGDVILRTGYINGPFGAACTLHLKKEVRYALEKEVGKWSGQVWGFEFTRNEINRAIRLQEQYPKIKPLFPLIEEQLAKPDCLAILRSQGIELPVMYRMGYHNNNCIGCVKGGISYWNTIRRDFPDVFLRMAQLERVVGHTCLKDDDGLLFLDELDPSRGRGVEPIVPGCSLMCQLDFEKFLSPRVEEVLDGKSDVYINR